MRGDDNGTVRAMRQRVSELVYSSVQIEGIASTFAQTEEILREGKSKSVDQESITKILGLKHALEHLFGNYSKPITWDLYASYNALVGEGTVARAGSMRGPGEVRVGDFIPEPNISVGYFSDLVSTAIDTAGSPSEAASQLFLLMCKAQFFMDGNKRSAQMLANHYLANTDSGRMLLIREDDRDEVLDLLVDFYAGDISLQDAEWDLEDIVMVRCEAVEARVVTSEDDRFNDKATSGPGSYDNHPLAKEGPRLGKASPLIDEMPGCEPPEPKSPSASRGSRRDAR